MQKMKPISIVFNAGGALVFFIIAAYTGRSLFYTETIESCSTRYSHLEQFPLKDEDGGLLSDVQLQAAIGYSEGMRLEGVKVMALKDRPDVAAFRVSLPEGVVRGISRTIKSVEWRSNGIRLVWIRRPVPA